MSHSVVAGGVTSVKCRPDYYQETILLQAKRPRPWWG